MAILEQCSAATTGLLTERTAKPRRARHVEATEPGALLSLDTFYVGKLKGVGKVWQITGCDAASSNAWARLVLGEVTAAAVLAFLREVVSPTYRGAGWRLRRVLTDNGKEFKGAFAAGCERLQITVIAHEAQTRVDQRLCGAAAENHPLRALADRLSPAVLHQSAVAARRARSVSAVL